MGNPMDFLTVPRVDAPERDPDKRLADYQEFQIVSPDELARTQAGRCMNCGIPFCHSGRTLSGTTAGCPIHNLIPDFNDLVFRGKWREAWALLSSTNNLPEVTGRVCPAPCEGSCTVGLDGSPVAIKSLEQAIADRAFAQGWVTPKMPTARSGFSVAVVGSGPAGLSCAEELNALGHSVIVYEKSDRPGGLLMYGIPAMKLDKTLLQRRVSVLEAAGVKFILGVEVGQQVSVQELLAQHDALVLAAGAGRPRDLPVDGRQFKGVHLAVPYLTTNTKSLLDTGAPPTGELSAHGKRVVVIGGGDTGTDCVATSLRQGAVSVTQLEVLPRPPDERSPQNPWPEWPKVLRVDYGQEEAAAKFGEDPRKFCVRTTSFEGDDQGRLVAVHTIRVERQGKGYERLLAGTEERIPAEMALLAMGFLGPEPLLPERLDLKRNANDTVWANEDKMTSVPGVFVAGDMSRGPSLVVWAIREGREVARAVERFLRPR